MVGSMWYQSASPEEDIVYIHVTHYALFAISVICFVAAALPTVFVFPKVRFEWLGVAFLVAAYAL